jgi:energy-coupling factor transporter transmembrane protein EcfT
MDPLFVWLESTSLSTWVRESTSILAFPFILALHTIGMAFVVGINGALDLRLLGVGSGIPVRELRRFFPILWVGFWLNMVTGLALLIGYPTKALTNPVFYLKLALIAAALVVLKTIGAQVFGASAREHDATTPGVKLLAAVSIACWLGAITSGRLLAYTYSRLTADF